MKNGQKNNGHLAYRPLNGQHNKYFFNCPAVPEKFPIPKDVLIKMIYCLKCGEKLPSMHEMFNYIEWAA
jgi:hypothetical protein